MVHSGTWQTDDPWVVSGKDPMLAPLQKCGATKLTTDLLSIC